MRPKTIDKAEELRLISKEHRWLAKHYRRLYELEMAERGLVPEKEEDPKQLSLFDITT